MPYKLIISRWRWDRMEITWEMRDKNVKNDKQGSKLYQMWIILSLISWALKYFGDLKVSEYFKGSICREKCQGMQMVKFKCCWRNSKEGVRNIYKKINLSNLAKIFHYEVSMLIQKDLYMQALCCIHNFSSQGCRSIVGNLIVLYK